MESPLHSVVFFNILNINARNEFILEELGYLCCQPAKYECDDDNDDARDDDNNDDNDEATLLPMERVFRYSPKTIN